MDEALDVLFRPWRASPPAFVPEDRVLFVGVDPHPDLDLALPARRVAVQPWRGPAQALEGSVEEVHAEFPEQGGFASALVRIDRQRECGLAELGRAMLALRPGGELIAAAPVREGGLRYVEALRELGVEVEVDVKARCRIARLVAGPGLDRARLAAWAALDAERPVLDGSFVSRPGLFGWDQVDGGSVALAKALPADLTGHVADAGSGWGWLARQALDRCPGITRIELLEADQRALALSLRNLEGRPVRGHWSDATEAWPVSGLDAVISNPPFHDRGHADPAIGQAFVTRAFSALRPGGRLFVVANVHLPYEGVLREHFGSFRTLGPPGGFKVLEATKPEPVTPRPNRRNDERGGSRRDPRRERQARS